MKKKEAIFILFLIAIVVAIIVMGAVKNNKGKKANEKEGENKVNYEVLEDGTKLNKSSKVNEDKTYNGLKFSNIQLTENGDLTSLVADVTNTTSTATSDFTMVDLTFYDESGNSLGSTIGLIKPLAAGETTQLNASLTLDYANAYDLKITEHKANQ